MFIHGLSLALNERSRKKTGRESEGSRKVARRLRIEKSCVFSFSLELKLGSKKRCPVDAEARYSENPVTAITGSEERRRERVEARIGGKVEKENAGGEVARISLRIEIRGRRSDTRSWRLPGGVENGRKAEQREREREWCERRTRRKRLATRREIGREERESVQREEESWWRRFSLDLGVVGEEGRRRKERKG